MSEISSCLPAEPNLLGDSSLIHCWALFSRWLWVSFFSSIFRSAKSIDYEDFLMFLDVLKISKLLLLLTTVVIVDQQRVQYRVIDD